MVNNLKENDWDFIWTVCFLKIKVFDKFRDFPACNRNITKFMLLEMEAEWEGDEPCLTWCYRQGSYRRALPELASR